MRTARPAGVAGVVGLVLLLAPRTGVAASFDCSARGLAEAELAICRDAQLSRSDEQMARRLAGLSRRLNFGQYLGLRYWHGLWRVKRDRCGADGACLAASYRTHSRFLDRLQQCLDNGFQRRACLRNTISAERETVRR